MDMMEQVIDPAKIYMKVFEIVLNPDELPNTYLWYLGCDSFCPKIN